MGVLCQHAGPPNLLAYTEKTILPIRYTLNGLWSWWQFSFRFWIQMELYMVQNRKENCHHDHIPFNLKEIGNIVFSPNLLAKTSHQNFAPKLPVVAILSNWHISTGILTRIGCSILTRISLKICNFDNNAPWVNWLCRCCFWDKMLPALQLPRYKHLQVGNHLKHYVPV